MARTLRVEFENALYHLCARGNRQDWIFLSHKDYARFEQFLTQSLERYRVELHSYVLLTKPFSPVGAHFEVEYQPLDALVDHKLWFLV